MKLASNVLLQLSRACKTLPGRRFAIDRIRVRPSPRPQLGGTLVEATDGMCMVRLFVVHRADDPPADRTWLFPHAEAERLFVDEVVEFTERGARVGSTHIECYSDTPSGISPVEWPNTDLAVPKAEGRAPALAVDLSPERVLLLCDIADKLGCEKLTVHLGPKGEAILLRGACDHGTLELVLLPMLPVAETAEA